MDAIGGEVLTVMDPVVTGRVENVFDGTQFTDDFRVEPELVHQTQLMVDQVERRRHEERHR